jgi:hypothetical protein
MLFCNSFDSVFFFLFIAKYIYQHTWTYFLFIITYYSHLSITFQILLSFLLTVVLVILFEMKATD